jgi:hypothetical protein
MALSRVLYTSAPHLCNEVELQCAVSHQAARLLQQGCVGLRPKLAAEARDGAESALHRSTQVE